MAHRRGLNFLIDGAAFALILAVQLSALYGSDSADLPPAVNDAMEVYDIGWNLAAGRGYGFDWDAAGFRDPWEAGNRAMKRAAGPRPSTGTPDLDFLDPQLAHHGPYHATLSRPPLMPLLVAAMLRLHPDRPFATWRAVDAVAFAAAGAVLAGAVRRRLGWYAAGATLAMLLLDRTRGEFVPGWWTEGLAFDGVAVLVALALTRASPRAIVCGGGVTLGLLCLDRSVFALMLPGFAAALACATADGWRRRVRAAVAVVGVAVLLQLPWWARNVAVSGRFLPLGTQGGMNLPDEYSDRAVEFNGWWTGQGMAFAWAAEPKTLSDRARANAAGVRALWPGVPVYAALVDAQTCQSLAAEIAVADVGQRTATAWVRRHPAALPALFAHKLWTLTAYYRPWLTTLAIAAAIGLAATRDRRPLWPAVGFVATYAVGIGLTHVVIGRFLVPILPALYALAAAGVGGVVGPLLSPRRQLAPTITAV